MDFSNYINEKATKETKEILLKLKNNPIQDQITDLKSQLLSTNGRIAAVLILLFLNEDGELGVILTTRSPNLRSHPGETALPGGRVDLKDESLIETALREANEEIGLPIEEMEDYEYLTRWNEYLSKNLIVVHPIIYLYLKPMEGLLERIKANEEEVSQVFRIDLKWILVSFLNLEKNKINNKKYLNYSFQDLKLKNEFNFKFCKNSKFNLDLIKDFNFRFHRFENFSLIPTALTGLTADILLNLTLSCFNLKQSQAENQLDWKKLIHLIF